MATQNEQQRKLRVLDLFSGIGGFSLGLERTGGFETVAFCEIDPFCQRVLRKHWPNVPIYDDVRTLGAIECDVVCGGFPCPPVSVAGRRGGSSDDRWLWPEMLCAVANNRPAWAIIENVAGINSMGLDGLLDDLDALGYSRRPFRIPAYAVGADHERDRTWVVAHDNQARLQGRLQTRADQEDESGESARRGYAELPAVDFSGHYREHQPVMGRGLHGVPDRVDRIKALGNAVVPQIPEIIGYAILAAEGRNASKGSG